LRGAWCFQRAWGRAVSRLAKELAPARQMERQVAQIAEILPRHDFAQLLDTRSQLLATMEPLVSVGERWRRDALTDVLKGVRLSEDILPASLARVGVELAGQLARVSVSDSAFTQWHSALAAEQSVIRLAALPTFETGRLNTRLVEDLLARTELNVGLSRLTSDALGAHVALATRPVVAYDSYLASLARRPTTRGQEFARTAGYAISGLVAHDVLSLRHEEPAEDEVAHFVEADIVEPWEQAGIDERGRLYRRLEEVNPRVADLLKGAWDSVANPGPADVVKIATCAVEGLLWALRDAAPDAEVASWVSATRPNAKGLLDDRARPTRAGRVRYLMRERQGDRAVVESQVEALVKCVEATHARLQGAKHASQGDVVQVRCHLMTTESILSQLFTVY
jgi:hypothetical protein